LEILSLDECLYIDYADNVSRCVAILSRKTLRLQRARELYVSYGKLLFIASFVKTNNLIEPWNLDENSLTHPHHETIKLYIVNKTSKSGFLPNSSEGRIMMWMQTGYALLSMKYKKDFSHLIFLNNSLSNSIAERRLRFWKKRPNSKIQFKLLPFFKVAKKDPWRTKGQDFDDAMR